jgi:hypothetical protein
LRESEDGRTAPILTPGRESVAVKLRTTVGKETRRLAIEEEFVPTAIVKVFSAKIDDMNHVS